jgi:hypothetical protein
MGFWTTRFVEAHTPSEAGERAVELVGQQLDGIIPPSATAPGITVAETWEGASQLSDGGSGRGFTWFAVENGQPPADPTAYEIKLEAWAAT